MKAVLRLAELSSVQNRTQDKSASIGWLPGTLSLYKGDTLLAEVESGAWIGYLSPETEVAYPALNETDSVGELSPFAPQKEPVWTVCLEKGDWHVASDVLQALIKAAAIPPQGAHESDLIFNLRATAIADSVALEVVGGEEPDSAETWKDPAVILEAADYFVPGESASSAAVAGASVRNASAMLPTGSISAAKSSTTPSSRQETSHTEDSQPSAIAAYGMAKQPSLFEYPAEPPASPSSLTAARHSVTSAPPRSPAQIESSEVEPPKKINVTEWTLERIQSVKVPGTPGTKTREFSILLGSTEGAFFIRTHDLFGFPDLADSTSYPTREAAKATAKIFAEEKLHDAIVRFLEEEEAEINGGRDANGQWTLLDNGNVTPAQRGSMWSRTRYGNQGAAEKAIARWYRQVRLGSPGHEVDFNLKDCPVLGRISGTGGWKMYYAADEAHRPTPLPQAAASIPVAPPVPAPVVPIRVVSAPAPAPVAPAPVAPTRQARTNGTKVSAKGPAHEDIEIAPQIIAEFRLQPNDLKVIQKFVAANGMSYLTEKLPLLRELPLAKPARALVAALKENWRPKKIADVVQEPAPTPTPAPTEKPAASKAPETKPVPPRGIAAAKARASAKPAVPAVNGARVTIDLSIIQEFRLSEDAIKVVQKWVNLNGPEYLEEKIEVVRSLSIANPSKALTAALKENWKPKGSTSSLAVAVPLSQSRTAENVPRR